jgi:predicted SPOUT superfamily RNA methylase MTH1
VRVLPAGRAAHHVYEDGRACLGRANPTKRLSRVHAACGLLWRVLGSFKQLLYAESMRETVAVQIEREAAKVNVRHGWLKPGDAWGYRRRAYRRMAELLQGPALERYDQVFAREPAHTRHICQETTPALLAPVKPKVFVE